ncbi:MAG: hypothetical protein VW450_05355 [Chloroflexota bacterium]
MTTAPKLALSLAFGANPRCQPILDGTVGVEGVALAASDVHAAELFHRQLAHQEFDVSEMSISSLLMIMAAGNTDWVALPIFTTRHFFGTGAYVNADAGITKPEDLRGRRIGLNEYQITAGLWSRGYFQHEHGLDRSSVEWWQERTPETSHAGASGFQPPADVTVKQIPASTSMGEMLVAGELDAILVYFWGGGVNRSTIDLAKHPKARLLFKDPAAEAARYYAKTGIFPFNHTVVVRRSIYERHPWVARSLLEAFEKAKQRSYAVMRDAVGAWVDTGIVPQAPVRTGLAKDLYPYGLAANRNVVETAMRFSHEQGLTPRVMTPEEVFAPALLDS